MSRYIAATAVTRNGPFPPLKSASIGNEETVSMSAYFRRDVRADSERWEELLAWLEENELKGRYGRISLSIHNFELVVAGCTEAQVQDFIERFEQDRNTMVMVKSM